PFMVGNPDGRFPLRYEQDGVRIFENPRALPRAFLVQRADVVAPDAVLERMVALGADLATTAVLEAPPPIDLPGGTPSGEARLADYSANRVDVVTRNPSPALLVLTDQDYPGWQAEVDGQPSPIQRADFLFRAVAVPAGEHRVVFRFVPRSFFTGV